MQDADCSVSLYRQWLLLLSVSVLCGLGTVSICPGGFLVLGVVVCVYSMLSIPRIYLMTVSHTLPVVTTKMFEALPNVPWERQDHPWWNVSLGSLLSCYR